MSESAEAGRPRVSDAGTIGHWMTPSRGSVGRDQPLAVAQRIMREKHLSALPVMYESRVVGVVLARDIRLVESMPGVDVDVAFTGDAMATFVFVSRADPVRMVVARMAALHVAAAVVLENDEAIGLFTAVGALDVLASLLSTVGRADRAARPPSAPSRPSDREE